VAVVAAAERFSATYRAPVEPMVVRIVANAWKQIQNLPYRHDAEIGCYLFGIRDRFEIIVRALGPVSCDHNRTQVKFDTQHVVMLEDDLRQRGSHIRAVGTIHSHPSGSLRPSRTDEAGAERWARKGNEDVVDLLVARAGNNWQLVSWIVHPDGYRRCCGAIVERKDLEHVT
jgi:proteasome lid subunit RPN8/RPN11